MKANRNNRRIGRNRDPGQLLLLSDFELKGSEDHYDVEKKYGIKRIVQESDESENPRTKESFRIGQSDSRRTKLDNRNNRRIGSELLITTPIIILFYYSREIVKRKET